MHKKAKTAKHQKKRKQKEGPQPDLEIQVVENSAPELPEVITPPQPIKVQPIKVQNSL